MPDFGIGEAIAALFGGGELFGGLFGGGEAIAAGVGAGEAVGEGLSAAELGIIGAGGTGGIEGAAPLAFTVNALEGAGAGEAAGVGFGDILGGLGGALAGGAGALSNALIPSAGAAELTAGATPGTTSAVGGGVSPTAGPGVSSNQGANVFQQGATDLGGVAGFGAPQGGGGLGAFTPTPGVTLPEGIAPDATSAAAFQDPTVTSFADRAAPAENAFGSGTFQSGAVPSSPAGSEVNAANFTNTLGGDPLVPPGGTPTASPNLGDFATADATTPAGATPASGTAPAGVAGNPLDITTNPVPAAGGQPAAGSTNILGKVGQGALDSVTKNPLGVGLGAAGLGLSLLNSKQQSDAVKALQSRAATQSNTGDQLAQFALNGTLPPGSQAGVDKAIAEAKANAISNAAGQGLPTDPTKNTALAATLAKIDQQGPIIAAQIAQQLLTSGASFSGLSNGLYTALAQIDQSQQAAMGKAIASFAAALSPGGTKIQIGGTA